MRLRNFYLFKLPIDNTYDNVFDGWATKEMGGSNPIAFSYYIDDLIRLYPNYTSPDQLNRSVKITNGVSSITLPIRYDFAKDFNYCILNTTYTNAEGQYTAFFITSVTSENDSDNNPSCALTVEYDVWANNYPRLVLDNYNRNGYISEGHIHRFVETQQTSDNTYTFRTTNSFGVRSQPPYIDSIVNNTKAKMLWLVYEWNVDYITANSVDYGNIPSYGQFVYTFAPWRIVEEDGFLTANFRGYPTNTAEYASMIPPATIAKGNPYLANLYLTYFPPFYFEVYDDGQDDGTGSNVPIRFRVIDSDITYADSFNIPTSTGHVTVNTDSIIVTRVRNVLETVDPSIKFGNYNKISISSIFENAPKSEIPYNNFPYKYQYGEFQGKRIDFVNGFTFPDYEITTTPMVLGQVFKFKNLTLNGATRKLSNIPLQQIGGLPFSVDRLSQYMANNAFGAFARVFTGSYSPAVNTVSSYSDVEEYTHRAYEGRKIVDKFSETFKKSGTKSVTKLGSFGGIAMNAVQLGAEMYSMARQPDEVKNASSFSQLMYFTLDRPIIHTVTTPTSEMLLNDFYLTLSNGYLLERYDDVISNYRTVFDYVRASDFNAVTIIPQFERQRVEQIIANGVRKWHIQNFDNPFYSADQQNKIKSLDTRVLNPEPFLI